MSVSCIEKENAKAGLALEENQIYLGHHNSKMQWDSFRETGGVGRKTLKTCIQSFSNGLRDVRYWLCCGDKAQGH